MNPYRIRTTPHYNPNPNRSRIFTVNFFSKPITTVVTATPAVAQEWIYTLRRNHHNDLYNGSLVIGLGVQWTPTYSSGEFPEAATIQLCVDSNCLIFQLSHAESVPATLRELVADVSVTLVGVHNGRDKRVLEGCRHRLEVGARVVDLAADQGRGNASMEELAAEVLGMEGVVKPRWLGFTDWGEFWLSDEQVQYACVDSHVSYLLALEFGYPDRTQLASLNWKLSQLEFVPTITVINEADDDELLQLVPTITVINEADDDELLQLIPTITVSNEADDDDKLLQLIRTITMINVTADDELLQLIRTITMINEAAADDDELLQLIRTITMINEAADDELLQFVRTITMINEAADDDDELLQLIRKITMINEAADDELLQLIRMIRMINEADDDQQDGDDECTSNC